MMACGLCIGVHTVVVLTGCSIDCFLVVHMVEPRHNVVHYLEIGFFNVLCHVHFHDLVLVDVNIYHVSTSAAIAIVVYLVVGSMVLEGSLCYVCEPLHILLVACGYQNMAVAFDTVEVVVARKLKVELLVVAVFDEY